jgi:hypothetical protein
VAAVRGPRNGLTSNVGEQLEQEVHVRRLRAPQLDRHPVSLLPGIETERDPL